MVAKRKQFNCYNCNVLSDKTCANYCTQFKRLGFVLCTKCSVERSSKNTKLRLNDKYSNIVKNNDIVTVICDNCKKSRNIQYRTSKSNNLCVDCAAKKRYNDNIVTYHKLAKQRINNECFSKSIINGMSKISKSVLSKNGSKNGLRLWDNREKREKELERRKTLEYSKSQSECLRGSNLLTTEEFICKSVKTHGDLYDYALANYTHSKNKIAIICKKHGTFFQTASDHISHAIGCPKCSYQITISKFHKQLIDHLNSLGQLTIVNDRSILSGLEIDIIVADKRFGIECHGVYWHSYNSLETVKQRLRHKLKADLAESANYKLFQIFEHEWRLKKDIIKSMINHSVGLSNKLYARKCEVKLIDRNLANSFLDNNHLNGHRQAKWNFGLIYNYELIHVLSISKHNKYDYELIRSASKCGYCIVGGLSKLLKYAKLQIGFNQLLTYADRRFSTANSYIKTGFNKLSATLPGYCYVLGNNVYSRQHFQKQKLQNLLDIYDNQLSESSNMFNNGYRRLWDAGHYKLLYKPDN